MGELSDRRQQSTGRIKELQSKLGAAEKLVKGKACVYATGSFGRFEASAHSDLDVFIVGITNDQNENLLNALDAICVKADLIDAARKLGLPEFSGDGRYLVRYSTYDFTKTLGTENDDVTNTFTARLLMLLESYPLLESQIYDRVTGDVIAAYWRDYADHKTNFVPAFLANDVLRLWRTFCVNYEARTERVPEDQKAKGKLKNYKLKHSRLLTCYSALLYLLSIYRLHSTVHPSDAIDMIKLTPTRRLEWVLSQGALSDAHVQVRKLMDQYEIFLATVNLTEPELVARFMDKDLSRSYMANASQFGHIMFEAITSIGNGSHFHRLLLV